MTNINPATPVTPPEIWYKGKRVLRTVVAVLVTLIPIVNLAAASVIDYLRTQQDVAVPGGVFIWLNAIVAGTTLIIGLITRIMAVPGVNAVLTKVGLGSVPADALIATPGNAEALVKVDPAVTTK